MKVPIPEYITIFILMELELKFYASAQQLIRLAFEIRNIHSIRNKCEFKVEEWEIMNSIFLVSHTII